MREQGIHAMMAGKMGVWGHIREMGGERRVILRGLPGGKNCILYQLAEGRAEPCTQTGEKILDACIRGAGRFFAAMDGQVIAWEEEAGAAGYFAACRALEKLRMPEEKAPPPSPPMPEPEKPEAPAVEEESFVLRSPGNGAPVDSLPPLIFPGASGALRVYFESCPPIRPFDASGWRFVRAPSSVRGAAYCALGMFQREGRVALIAYALPGHPQRPPVPLPGYRYQMGLRGQGYWVFTERV